ncbi:endo alpha-1,4 polygalactosaminidase, partial [Deinococcus ruber]|uniref:endo alpha-1,4 polygalactosaminidase n=1 Tax=Deinococcus ruber TaxID=1848197 RepID=UPI001667B5A0
ILKNRFAMCKSKGFDALEPDNLQNDENVSGGKITTQQQIDFNGWVADAAHAAGLAVFQKNGPDKILLKDRTGAMMVDKFDGILNEQCQEYGECAALAEYPKRGKLALDAEYQGTLDCATFAALGVNAIKKDLNLTAGTRSACD